MSSGRPEAEVQVVPCQLFDRLTAGMHLSPMTEFQANSFRQDVK
jgi:hypothetical protein